MHGNDNATYSHFIILNHVMGNEGLQELAVTVLTSVK